MGTFLISACKWKQAAWMYNEKYDYTRKCVCVRPVDCVCNEQACHLSAPHYLADETLTLRLVLSHARPRTDLMRLALAKEQEFLIPNHGESIDIISAPSHSISRTGPRRMRPRGPTLRRADQRCRGRYVEMDSDSNAAADIQPSFHLV